MFYYNISYAKVAGRASAMQFQADVTTWLDMGGMERIEMAKSGETKFLGGEQERVRVATAADMRVPKPPVAPRPKKERPASKGRVHKGRTRN